MKITLAGSPGSGKSTLRRMLAEHYGLKTKGTGDFMRELEHPEVDHQVDEEQRLYGEQNEDFVLDAHLGFYFVPDSIQICLICDLEEAARRILEDTERTTEEAKTIRESIDTSQKRRDTMRRNFLSLYKVDIDDRSNFDLLLDTSSLSSAEVFERVSTFIDEQTSNI